MSLGHERFARWLAESGLTKAAVAERLPCSAVFVGFLVRGERDPGLAVAQAIEELTSGWADGAVRTEDWLSPSESRVGRPEPTTGEPSAITT